MGDKFEIDYPDGDLKYIGSLLRNLSEKHTVQATLQSVLSKKIDEIYITEKIRSLISPKE